MILHNFPYLDTRDLNLDWLLKNMKQIIQEWAEYQQTMNQQFSDLHDAFTALQNWVNDYFDNLDVQQEINNKISDMVTSGEFEEIVAPYITSTTTSWLADHITNPSNPPIDTSLSVSNAAADSKVVGDRLKGVNSAIEAMMDLHNVPTFNHFYQGDIDADGEAVVRTDNKTFICDYISQENITALTVNAGYTVTVFYYDSSKSFISYNIKYAGSYSITPGSGFLRLRIVKGSYAVFTAIEAETVSHILYRDNGFAKALSMNRLRSDNIVDGYIHDGYYYDLNGERQVAGGDWGYTPLCAIEAEKDYYFYSFARKNKTISNSYINFYDADKEWMSSRQLYDNINFSTPTNTCYFRVSCPWTELRYIYITDSSTAPLWYKRFGQDTPVNTLTKYQRNSYANVISIAKDGINTLAELSGFPIYPHCSKYSYISAIYEGFEGLLMHVMKTSDNKFVLSHENNLAALAKNDDGTALASPYNISDHTLAEVQAVDMGYDYGTMYRGTRIMTLQEGLALAKALNVYLVIEPSGLTQSDYATLAGIIKQYGFRKNVGVHSYYANSLREVKTVIPEAMLLIDGTGSAEYINAIITDAIALKTDKNVVCVGKLAALNNNMTETLVQRMIDNDISYFIANPTSEPAGFLEYMADSPLASYVTFVDSQCIPASKMLLDNII